MTLRRVGVLTAAAVLLIAGCGADSPETEAPEQTEPVPEDVTDGGDADAPADADPAPATSALAEEWASLGMSDADDLDAQLDAMAALLPPEMPVPSDGDPYALIDPGFNAVGIGAPDDPMSDGCAGNVYLGVALAEGSQSDPDLAPSEEWFTQRAADNDWTIVTSQPRWTENDLAWEYGSRGTVYRLEGHGEVWNVSVTLSPYAQSVEYCPVT